jgi:hypothetical protein
MCRRQAHLLVAEQDGPTMFARIGVMRALNRHVERAFDPSRKDSIGDAGSWRGMDDESSEVSAGALAGPTLVGLRRFRPCA